MSTPLELVEHQLAAYNAHDLQRFLEVFSDEIEAFRMPDATPFLSGKAAYSAHYAKNRFTLPALHAEVLSRMIMGNKVIDHERITGLGPQPIEAIAIYAVENGLIRRVWFLDPEA